MLAPEQIQINGNPPSSTARKRNREISDVSARKLQVGIMIIGTTIDGMVLGGPASNSGRLSKGDVILEVDGLTVTSDTVAQALLGSDIPGTSLRLKVIHLVIGRRGDDRVFLGLHGCMVLMQHPEWH